MQKIGATGDGKSAVATPDGKKPKEEEVLAESEQQRQHMIDKLDATCQQYGMVMNAKRQEQTA